MKSLLLPCFIICCLSLTAQWDRQNPYNHIGMINDIIVNDSYGAAAGDDATIFLSNDAGSSWDIRDNDLNGWNFSTIERNEDLIYACGKGIYKSDDGGASFDVIPNTPTDIFDSYLSESGVLIVANKEGVYKSLDQGATFISLNTPVDSLGNNSFIHDENHIWWATTGLSPTLYITTDGGDTWETNTELVRPEYLTFYDKDNGVVKSFGYLHYTEDGGRTWEERVQLSRGVGSIAFGESRDIGYITSGTNLYTTYDGFKTLSEFKRLITSANLNGIYKVNDETVLVGGDFSSIIASKNEGITWNDVTGKVKHNLNTMASTNGQEAYAGGRETLLSTEDGGNTWNIFDTLSTFIYDISIIEDEALILAGNQKIIRKDLNTKEEKTIYGPTPGAFTDFHITASGRWIAYSTSDFYLTSDDRGNTWDSIYIEKNSNGIEMHDNGDLFMGIRGKLLFSNDEGDTWNEIYTANEARDIRAMSLIDSTIYLMESTKNIRKSTDYGLTWDSLATPTGFSMIVRSMHFINQDTGYIYDSTGDKLWYTYDGGLTWPFSYVPRAEVSGIYQYSNNDIQSVWIYGLGGFIEKQSDCKNPPLLSDIEGTVFPCILDTVTFSVTGSNIDNYVWSIPNEWVVVGADDGPEITIYAEDPGAGYLTVYGENGCGNTDALELQIAGTAIPEVELLQFGDVLRTEADGVSYAWYKDGDIIVGADKDFYNPTENGDYTVLVTFSTTCSRLSNSITIIKTTVSELNENTIKIYPNPIQGNYFHIEHNLNFELTELAIFDTMGTQIRDLKVSNSKNSSLVEITDSILPGIYFVRIQNCTKPLFIVK